MTEGSALFDALWVWDDVGPRPGAMQMAVDEVLLASCPEVPVLRHYRWQGRVATYGYSQTPDAAAAAAPGFELVRRRTGGGVVLHERDWTFSLIVPRRERFAQIRPSESYCLLHGVIAAAMQACGIPCALAKADAGGGASACFVSPVPGDILDPSGLKLCGGAQRRTRQGVLHQGSLLHALLPPHFLHLLSAALATTPTPYEPLPSLEAEAAQRMVCEIGV